MKRIGRSLAFALVLGAVFEAQTPQPTKPSAEHQKLQMLTGNWTFQGEAAASPFGPAGKVTGSDQTRAILGGFAIQRQVKEKGPAGELEQSMVIGYDTAKKTYTYYSFDSAGGFGSGTATLSANTFSFQGTYTIAGKAVGDRCDVTVAANQASVDVKCDGAADGKTWVPSFTGKWTKSGSED
jgi:hypothetical protein